MDLTCQTDLRRNAVRSHRNRNGLDYVEVGDDQLTLYAYFLGKLPAELAKPGPQLKQYLRIDGGDSISGLQVTGVDPVAGKDATHDDYLVVHLDRTGDFSTYTLSLVGVEGIDPFYDQARFNFKICCGSDLDCKAPCGCEPPVLQTPPINYLAKDYASFRQLILDRLSLLMPGWTERHVPDLQLTLVEVLAYVGDYLSYYQDAVATEAYLGTARQRISVRRHARLVDYTMHEGCNARAWLHFDVSQDYELDLGRVAFISGANGALPLKQSLITVEQLNGLPSDAYEYFEPLPAVAGQRLPLRQKHNQISFYTWGQRECCLMPGATSATLLDQWVVPQSPPPPPPLPAPTPVDEKSAAVAAKPSTPAPTRALQLQVGDVLIFEEVLGARTGVSADADPARRWAVRLTRVEVTEDSLYTVAVGSGDSVRNMATPVVRIEWAAEDALPFSLCLSTVGAAPNCAYLTDVTVARGNILLVDHGRSLDPQPLGPVPGDVSQACCECEGEAGDVTLQAGRYRPSLTQTPLTYRQALASPPAPASRTLLQDPRLATPVLGLVDSSGARWTAQTDLIESAPDDRDFVAEIDNDGHAHLRFGDGELGRAPEVGSHFTATYRVGGGSAGNIGAEAICRIILKQLTIDGPSISVRNPLPAQGGIDPETIDEARLFAPGAFRKQLERAITADDYATLAGANPKLQRAEAQLNWTGSWYEADVGVDPWGGESASAALLQSVRCDLERYRRMGHDLRVLPAVYVPILLKLSVCALPGYDRGHLRAALLARFGNRRNADGTLGFFHPDELSFGEGLYLSRIIAAAQAITGVECVTVTAFHRLFAPPAHEIDNGLLPLAVNEIAQLDNDPNHPERGQLVIEVRGGR